MSFITFCFKPLQWISHGQTVHLRFRTLVLAILVSVGLTSFPIAAHSTAVFELDGTFFVVPTKQAPTNLAGKYCGKANLVSAFQNGERYIMIDINSSGKVVVTGEDQAVNGSLSGTTITASFPINTSGCTGNFSISGKAVGNVISGPVSGNISCLDGAFTGPVTGSFSTTKTSASSCPGIP